MNIVITGATSVIGRAAAAYLLGAGHRVIGVAQHRHPLLDPAVELVCTSLDGPRLREVADGADVVLHLAPVEAAAPECEGLEGLLRVSDAAARAGARLLFVSHAAGDPELYHRAEDLVATSWAPSLVIRCAPVVGRQADWMVCRSLATVGRGRSLPLLHTDDLLRFLVRSVGSHRTGSVDLAADGVLAAAAARRWSAPPGCRRTPAWPVTEPEVDVVALQRDWDFTCGWDAADALADAGRALTGRRLTSMGAVEVTAAQVLPVEPTPRPRAGTGGHAAAGAAGEFDDVIDAEFGVFDTRGTADALPGPLTPMSLDVHGGGLRAAQHAGAEVMALPGRLAQEWQWRASAVFGHRIFTGRTVSDAVAATLNRRGQQAAVAPRVLTVTRRYDRWCANYGALRGQPIAIWPAASNAVLETRIMVLRNRIHQGWVLVGVGAVTEGLLLRAAHPEHPLPPATAEMTATGQLADGTATLAALLRTDRDLRELAAAGDWAAIRGHFPRAAVAVDAVLRRVGHRGPGEAELANPTTIESPSQLLVAAARAADTEPQTPFATGRAPLPLRVAQTVGRSRALAWDTTMCYTQQLRMALRERGRRLAAARVLARADDIFYLTIAEAIAPPVDTRLRVTRRRAERVRLQALNMPEVIDGYWSALPDPAPEQPMPAEGPRVRPVFEPAVSGWMQRVRSIRRDRPAFGT